MQAILTMESTKLMQMHRNMVDRIITMNTWIKITTEQSMTLIFRGFQRHTRHTVILIGIMPLRET